MRTNFLTIILSFILWPFPLVLEAQIPMPDNVCQGETRHYYVEPSPGSTYIWRINGIIQQGQSSNEFVYTWNTGNTYLLEVLELSFDGCTGVPSSGLVNVSPAGRNCLIIREAFSPNGDLINDTWEIGNKGIYPFIEVRIYNRWGQMVWKSARGYPVPWDGTNNGRALPIDSYHYVIDLHNGSKPLAGDVTIVM